MADIKGVHSGKSEVNNLTGKPGGRRGVPSASKTGKQEEEEKKRKENAQAQFPVGQPGEKRRAADAGNLPQNQKILPQAAERDASQTEAARHITALGGSSATDRLLGLDLRPTMTGILAPPPGNSEFLRHVSPPMRRTIMRKMLTKQRERMRRLARFLRDRRDESDAVSGGEGEDRESFLEVIAEKMRLEEYNADENQILRATTELDKTARMLDILDEMLAMQDYTISQIGSFTQG